jgi:hypothetical protein
MKNTVFSCLVQRAVAARREHSSHCCVFAGTCMLSRCLAMGIFLPLGATAEGELWPPEQSAYILHFFSPSLHFHFTEIIMYIFADVDLRSIRPSEADCLVSDQLSFYGVRLLASRPTPNLEDQGMPLRLTPTPWPVRHGCPTSRYTTAGIALRVSGALKLHHHDKMETPSVGAMGICVTLLWS